jgi:cysteine desulfurase family protein (TIGR01976 family)
LVFPVSELRQRFPALRSSAAFLDAPAGTQVPQQVIDAISSGLTEAMSNVGGGFSASLATDRIVDEARVAGADFLGGAAEQVVFGANMTSLTFSFSRAVAQEWQPGDRIVLSGLDHDANVTPWVRAAVDHGVEVMFADLRPEDVSLDLDHLASLISPKTRLVAVTACSNAFGTLVDIPRVADAAHRVGALLYVDAVHMAPHRRIDVEALGCDFLVCSSYKFFGPHLGVLWGRPHLLERLPAFKVRPAPEKGAGRWETGTQPFELMSGFTACVDYLAGLGLGTDRRARLDDAYRLIAAQEAELGRRFLAGLGPGVRLWGVPAMEGRVPTFALSVGGRPADEVGKALAEHGIFVWAGHHYAIEPMRRLGVLDGGGLLRIGFVHVNTLDEVDRVLSELAAL